jgi:predicted AAA+ superfamily ATPase
MIKRKLQAKITELLRQFPAVAILGPRQAGKTTLAKLIAASRKKTSLYLDMEKPSDRNRMNDAHSYLENYKDNCVIIDEVQLLPHLFSELRPLIDEHRKPGRFILLGSASPALVKGVSESLTGRISYTELTPVGLMELPANITQQKHWLRGGFPDALLAKSDLKVKRWMENFTRGYVERDLELLFGVNLSSVTVQKLWTMLAHSNGSVWNAEVFSRSLGITAPTVLRYMDYLEGGYLMRRLQPWYVNAKKRLVKSPKVYIRDSGILHHLLKLNSIDELLGHPIAGTSWEGYVIEQLFQAKPQYLDMYFYRTHDGAECDVVLVKGIAPLACIEIKLTNAPSISKGFYTSVADLNPKKKFVITPASEDYPAKDGVVVTSLRQFLFKHLPALK